MRDEATFVLAALDTVVTRIPPGRKLSDEEKATLQGPLEAVLYKYGANIPCEWQLGFAVLVIGAGRFEEYKTAKRKAAKDAEDRPVERY